jgi:CheY-like chemotaxis protein
MRPIGQDRSAFDAHEAPTLRRRYDARVASVVDPLVLVAEDDNDARSVYCASLEHLGYATIERSDGVAALQAAREHRPDVALMDVAMPRLDGLEAARCMRADARTRGCFIVLMTAFGDGSFAEAMHAGCDAFVCKPFNPFVLDEIFGALRLHDRDGIVKVCACGREFTRAGWKGLPVRGAMHGAELRNCPCGSSLALSRRDLAAAGTVVK